MLDAWPGAAAGYPDILRGVKKVLVSLDEQLLERIDAAAQASGLSRSAWLAARSQEALGGPPPTKAEINRQVLAEIREILAEAPPIYGPHMPAWMEIRRMRDERAERVDRSAGPRSGSPA